jgi:hypothetical protein
MTVRLDPLEHAFTQLHGLPALRAIKGCLIGNKRRKLALAGTLPYLERYYSDWCRLLSLIRGSSDF